MDLKLKCPNCTDPDTMLDSSSRLGKMTMTMRLMPKRADGSYTILTIFTYHTVI